MKKKTAPILVVLALLLGVGLFFLGRGLAANHSPETPPAQSVTPEITPDATTDTDSSASNAHISSDTAAAPETTPVISSPADNFFTTEELISVFQKVWNKCSITYKTLMETGGKIDDFGDLEARLQFEKDMIDIEASQYPKELPSDYKEQYIQWRPDESTLFEGIEAPDTESILPQPPDGSKPNDEPYTPPTPPVETQKPVETPSTPPPATQPPVETPPTADTPVESPADEEINQPPKDGEEGYIHYEDTAEYKNSYSLLNDAINAGYNTPAEWYNAVAAGNASIPERFRYYAGVKVNDSGAIWNMQSVVSSWHSPYDTEYWERYEYRINNIQAPDIQVGIGW